MYERFTDRARKVMQFANQESQRFHHEYIGTEHILLGLVREGAGVAANVLKNLDVDLDRIRREVEQIVMPAPEPASGGRLRQSPRAKKVIEYAIEEARKLNHKWVGTEHILLGLLREEEGVAAQVLLILGVNLTDVRDEILNLLGRPDPSATRRERLIKGELCLPPHVNQTLKELDAEIYRCQVEIEAAIAEQDFERAAQIRDEADRIKQTRTTLIKQWHHEYPVDPSWLLCNEGRVVKIARIIDKEQRWQELPILADALEEAGCTDQVILDHCRQPGEHTSGCWVIDLLLHKE
jgi:ATP-dependent Clp protease ATP-binding subunit ClpA